MSSSSARCRDDYERAERTIQRRAEPHTYRSVERALEVFWTWRLKLQSPSGLVPRADNDIEGGLGSQQESIRVTISVIGRAMHALKVKYPVAYGMIEDHFRDGKTQKELSDKYGKCQSTVSSELGRGIAFLDGCLHELEILA